MSFLFLFLFIFLLASSFIFPSISSVPSLLGVKEGSSFEGTYFQTNTGHPEGITRYLGKGISFEMEKFYIKASGGTVSFTPETFDLTYGSGSWQLKPLQENFFFNYNKKNVFDISINKDLKDSFSLFVTGDYHLNLSYFKNNVLTFCSLTSSIIDKKCTEKNILDLNSVYKVSLSKLINLLYESFSSFLSLYDINTKNLTNNLDEIIKKLDDKKLFDDIYSIKTDLTKYIQILDEFKKNSLDNHNELQKKSIELSLQFKDTLEDNNNIKNNLDILTNNYNIFSLKLNETLLNLKNDIHSNIINHVDENISRKLLDNIDQKMNSSSLTYDDKFIQLYDEINQIKQNSDFYQIKEEEFNHINSTLTTLTSSLNELTSNTFHNISIAKDSLMLSLEMQSDIFSGLVNDLKKILQKEIDESKLKFENQISELETLISSNYDEKLLQFQISLVNNQTENNLLHEKALNTLDERLAGEIQNIKENILGKLNQEIESTKLLIDTTLSSKLSKLEEDIKNQSEKFTSKTNSLESSLINEEKIRKEQNDKLKLDLESHIKEYNDFKVTSQEKFKVNEKNLSDQLNLINSKIETSLKAEEISRSKIKDDLIQHVKTSTDALTTSHKREFDSIKSDIKKHTDKISEVSSTFQQNLKEESNKREKSESTLKDLITQVNNKVKDSDSTISKHENSLNRLKDDHDKLSKSFTDATNSNTSKFKEIELSLSSKSKEIKDLESNLTKENEKLSSQLAKETDKISQNLIKESERISNNINKENEKISQNINNLTNMLKSEEKERISFQNKIKEDLGKHVDFFKENTNNINLKLKDLDTVNDKIKSQSDKITENFNKAEAIVKNEEKQRIALQEKITSLDSKLEKFETNYNELLVENKLLKASNQQLENKLDKLNAEVIELRSLLMTQVTNLVSIVIKNQEDKKLP